MRRSARGRGSLSSVSRAVGELSQCHPQDVPEAGVCLRALGLWRSRLSACSVGRRPQATTGGVCVCVTGPRPSGFNQRCQRSSVVSLSGVLAA